MREWVRARGKGLTCGSCAKEIPDGRVHLEIRIEGAFKRLRCAPCAVDIFGEAAPVNLPSDSIAPQPALPLDAAPAPTQGFVRADKRAIRSSLASAVRDYRERQAGHD